MAARWHSSPSAGPDKPHVLWLRPLDSLTAQPIPGTEGAVGPVLVAGQPANRVRGKRQTGRSLPPQAGRRKRFATRTRFDGATWNRDGVILFLDNRQPLPRARHGRRRQRWCSPRMHHAMRPALDFRSFFPMAGTSSFRRLQARQTTTFSRPARWTQKLSRASGAGGRPGLYAPPGYLFYMDQRTLMARPFNARALRFTGPAAADGTKRRPHAVFQLTLTSPSPRLVFWPIRSHGDRLSTKSPGSIARERNWAPSASPTSTPLPRSRLTAPDSPSRWVISASATSGSTT